MAEWYDKHTPAHEIGDWVERASPGSAYPIGTRGRVAAWGPYPDSYYLTVEALDPENRDPTEAVLMMGAALRPADPPADADPDDAGQDLAEADPYLEALERIAGHLASIAAWAQALARDDEHTTDATIDCED